MLGSRRWSAEFLGASSAGVAGLDPRTAQAWWEESRHRLRTPGAYEWWYFYASNPAGDGIQMTLFEGLPFHPKYLEQINRFDQRLAASLFAKPWPELQASRYPAAYFAVYEGGKRIAQFLNLYPPDTSVGQEGVPDIRIGPNRITLRRDESIGIVVKGYPFAMSRGRPKRLAGQILSAQLTFDPTVAGVQHTRPFRAPDRSGTAHHWVLSAPHGRMTGLVRCVDHAQGDALVEMQLDALGYHDHVYGQGGLATGVNMLTWGFIQGDTWTAAWHQSVSGGKGKGANPHADGLMFFEVGHSPLVVDAPETKLSKPQRSNWWLKHPGKIVMHGSDAHGHALEVLLTHGATLDAAPFHTRLAATGTVTIPGRGGGGSFTGTGATHILKLNRLRWPVLSDLTLLAILPISRDDPIWSE